MSLEIEVNMSLVTQKTDIHMIVTSILCCNVNGGQEKVYTSVGVCSEHEFQELLITQHVQGKAIGRPTTIEARFGLTVQNGIITVTVQSLCVCCGIWEAKGVTVGGIRGHGHPKGSRRWEQTDIIQTVAVSIHTNLCSEFQYLEWKWRFKFKKKQNKDKQMVKENVCLT